MRVDKGNNDIFSVVDYAEPLTADSGLRHHEVIALYFINTFPPGIDNNFSPAVFHPVKSALRKAVVITAEIADCQCLGSGRV